MKTKFIIILLGCLIALLTASLIQAKTSGRFHAGYQSMETNSGEFGAISMAIWYPTKQRARKEQLGPFEVKVAFNAAPAKGVFPVVLISHGTGGTILGHRDTAQYLARRGIIAVSLSHPRNNFEDNQDEATTDNWINRPKHVSAVLDTILVHPKFSNHIDQEKIAVIGHSAGGYTALALIGGIPDTSRIRLHCEQNYLKDRAFCDLGKGKEDRNWDIIITDAQDTRFKAGVLLAPVGVPYSGSGSLDQVTAPVFVYRSEFDRQTSFPFHADMIARSLTNSDLVQYQVLKNATHFSFIAPFPEFLKEEVGEAAYDPPCFNRKRAHKKINKEILTFLKEALGI